MSRPRRVDVPLLAVLLLALAARLLLASPRLQLPPDDPDNYLPLAVSLASGQGLRYNDRPTAYRPPLYPLLLAPLAAIFGPGPALPAAAQIANALLGAVAAGLTLSAARGMGLNARAATFAGLIVALDPVLVAQARSVMTETLAATLLAAALALAARGQSRRSLAFTGVLLALAALTRPSTLPGACLAVLATGLTTPGSPVDRLKRTAILALGLLLTLLPWAIRNAIVLGEPVFTTTHGGYTLYLANNPEYYADVLHGPPHATWSGPNQHRFFVKANRAAAGLPEPAADRLLRDQALRFIADHPLDFLRASLARLARFWALAPAPTVYGTPLRLLTAAWTIPFWLLAVCGLLRRDSLSWPLILPITMILGLTLVHALYWTDLRMRAPIVPALGLLAARGVSQRWERTVIPGVSSGMLE